MRKHGKYGWRRGLGIAVLAALLAGVAPAGVAAAGTATGAAYSWGATGDGRLGRAGGPAPELVAPPAGLDDVVALAAGRAHSMALTGDGRVLTWGDDSWGQLGRGGVLPGADDSVPTPVDLPAGVTATAIAAGADHSLAIGVDQQGRHRVFGWGRNTSAQLSLDPTRLLLSTTPREITLPEGAGAATAVAGGDAFSLALAGGTVYAWGDGRRGQLGASGPTGDLGSTFGVTPRVVTGLSQGVAEISAGGAHGLALRSGAVLAWGDNSDGQLGDPETVGQFRPDPVAHALDATGVAAGGQHSAATSAGGALYTWGRNAEGQLGRAGDPALPAAADLPHAPQVIAAGGSHTLAAVADGDAAARVWSFGLNAAGQLGRDGAPGQPAPAAPIITSAVAVAAGDAHSLALAAPRLRVDPATLDFPNVLEVGTTSDPLAVTVDNDGPGRLRIAAITVPGGASSDFAVTGDTCTDATLAPGEHCSVTVTFSPVAIGDRTGTLKIESNAFRPTTSVRLSGVGSVVQGDVAITTGEPLLTVPASPSRLPLSALVLQPGSPMISDVQAAGGLPLGDLTGIGGLPLGDLTGIGGLPLGDLTSIAPLAEPVLDQVTLAALPLLDPYAWDGPDPGNNAHVLAASPALHDQPLQQVTLRQVLADPEAGDRLRAVPLAKVGWSLSPLAGSGLLATMAGRTPLANLHAPGLSPTETWCPAIEATGFADCGRSLARDPDADANGLTASAYEMQLAGVPLSALSLAGIRLDDITPVPDAPYLQVPLHRVDLYRSSLGGIAVASLPDPEAVLTDCSGCTADTTLYEVAARVRPSATLADVVPAVPDLTLGALVLGLLPVDDDIYSTASLTALGVEHYGGAGASAVPYRVTYRNSSGAALPTGTHVAVDLPASFVYVPGSSAFTVDGTPAAVGPARLEGQRLRWEITASVPSGSLAELRFMARPGLLLGIHAVPRVAVEGSQQTVAVNGSLAPVRVIDGAEAGAGNDTPASATAIVPSTPGQTGDLVVGHIAHGRDVDLYALPADGIAPGSLIVAQLEHQQAGDADLSLFGTAGMTGETPLRPVSGAPAESVVLDERAALAGTDVARPSDLQRDIPLVAGRPVLGVSQQRDTASELVTAVAGVPAATGDHYLLQVSGYNGAFADQPYSLRVKVLPAATPPPAAPRFPDPQPANPDTLPAPSELTGTRHLILHAPSRLARLHGGSTAVDQALAALGADAALSAELGRMAVLEIDAGDGTTEPTAVQAALAAWDAHPNHPDRANDVVRAINGLVDGYRRDASLDLATITIVGGDEVIPMARLDDLTIKVNERGYTGEAARLTGTESAVTSAALTGHQLSDDPYGALQPAALHGFQALYLPDLAVGRLVETPAQIAAAADRFRLAAGVADPASALTTSAAPFLDDMASRIDAELAEVTGNRRVLIDSPWTREEFLAEVGSGAGLLAFNGHSDPTRTESRTSQTAAELITSADVAGVALGGSSGAGAVTLSVGCHTGLPLPDGQVVAGTAAEWSQSLLGQGAAAFTGPTGYGIGSRSTIALTEQLMLDVAGSLDEQPLGHAVVAAKQRYVAETAMLDVFDTKALAGLTYYGLPMLRLPGATADATTSIPTAGSLGPVGLDPVTGLPVAAFEVQSVDPSAPGYVPLTRHDTADGSYWSAGGRTLVTPGRPVLPVTSVDVTQPGYTASGVLITGLRSQDELGFDPVLADVVATGGADGGPEGQAADVAWPAAPQALRHVGGRDAAVIVAGGFNGSGLVDGRTVGRMRRFVEIDGYAIYGAPSGFPATIRASRGAVVTGVATFVVDVEPTAGDEVVDVLLLVRDGAEQWRPLHLVPDPAATTWRGGLPVSSTEVEYLVQAVTASGRVSVLANKARLLTAPGVVNATPGVDVTISGTGAPSNPTNDGSGWLHDATVTLQPIDPTEVVHYRVNGGPEQPASGPILFVGDGADAAEGTTVGDGWHLITYDVGDVSGVVVVKIDSQGPTVAIDAPTDGSVVTAGDVVTPLWRCVDAASGVVSCAGTVDGQPVVSGQPLPPASVGRHTLTVTSTDGAGHTTTKVVTWTAGYRFEGFLSPVANRPALNTGWQAGQTIPLKWRLYDGEGTEVTRLDAVVGVGSYQFHCPAVPGDDTTGPAGSTAGLTYTDGHYQYNWSTSSSWAGTCRRFLVTLDDGLMYGADFKLR